MNRRSCVMCDLASTVNIMPVGKSLNKFGLLSKEIYHDLHKTNVNEGIKWRGLLHSINFQENKLARLALIELVRIENSKIADELEKREFRKQIGCVCGQSSNAPHLKRSNSLSHIMETSGNSKTETFISGQGQFDFGAFNFSKDDLSDSHHDDNWKYMSLQPLKSPGLQTSKQHRRSRSLEILRPFTALDRQIYIPKNTSDTSSESDSNIDEIDSIFADISSLNKDYENEDDQTDGIKDGELTKRKDSWKTTEGQMSSGDTRVPRSESDDIYYSGFPSTSSLNSVVERVSFDDVINSVFAVEQHNSDIGSPDMESTRVEQDVTSDDGMGTMSSTLLYSREQSQSADVKDKSKDNTARRDKLLTEPVHTSLSAKKEKRAACSPKEVDINYNLLLVIILVIICLLAAVLYFLPERLISSVVVYIILHLYKTRIRDAQ